MTKVIFYKERDGEGVFAYFPEMVHNDEIMSCYAHIGQHSACHPDYAKQCKEANYNEYLDLLKELIQIGYNDLFILNKQTFEYWRKPTEFEVKIGEGAIHWLTCTMADTGFTKKGDLKKWFVSPYDKLRYYK